jgi:hypothetical protein
MARSRMIGPRWTATSARQAVIDVLVKSHINNELAPMQDYIVHQVIDYYIEQETGWHFNALQARRAILKLKINGSILKIVDEYDQERYCLPPAAVNRTSAQWKACPRYSAPMPSQWEHWPCAPRGSSAAVLKEKEKQADTAAKKINKKKHWVYYVRWDNEPTLIKIGYSSSPAGRIAGFLTGSPRNLQLLRLEPVASAQEEVDRHLKFNEYRHTREWFRYEGALKEYVQSLSVDHAVELWERFPAPCRRSINVEYF